MKITFYSRADKTHFQWKAFALSFVLKESDFGTRKWPIVYCSQSPWTLMPHCMLPPVELPLTRSRSAPAVTETFPGKTVMQAWVSSLIHSIHTHKFSRPICTGFGWEMLPWKIGKHFPLGNYFINFHSFFSWLCKGRPRDSKTVLYSKFHIRGFWIPITGFRIPIVSGHGFLELFSGVQSPGSGIPWAKISWIPGPDSLTWSDRGNLMLVSLGT